MPHLALLRPRLQRRSHKRLHLRDADLPMLLADAAIVGLGVAAAIVAATAQATIP
jgi:hypothetical protein